MSSFFYFTLVNSNLVSNSFTLSSNKRTRSTAIATSGGGVHASVQEKFFSIETSCIDDLYSIISILSTSPKYTHTASATPIARLTRFFNGIVNSVSSLNLSFTFFLQLFDAFFHLINLLSHMRILFTPCISWLLKPRPTISFD